MKKLFAVISALGFLSLISLSSMALAAPLSLMQESIPIGRTLSMGLDASSSWQVIANSNTLVASAEISGSNLIIRGLSVGSSTVSACTNVMARNCVNVSVNVTGSVLGLYTATHPAGSWVISGATVYYVTEAGLVPISTWQIFLSNGGKASKIVQASGDDLNLPMLDLMVMKDPRVK